MKQSSNRTEQEILEVAERLFLTKGFSRTSTVEIAKEAGCNQALVHYYFRTKEKLFQRIFSDKLVLSLSNFSRPLAEDTDFLTKIRRIVDTYFEFLSVNETLPYFLVSELLTSSSLRQMLVDTFFSNPKAQEIFRSFDASVREEVAKGTIRRIDTFNLMMDIISLCLSTFIAKPIITTTIKDDPNVEGAYLDMRRREIGEVLVSGIKA